MIEFLVTKTPSGYNLHQDGKITFKSSKTKVWTAIRNRSLTGVIEFKVAVEVIRRQDGE